MAKKSLKVPQLPNGAQKDFFVHMQRIVLEQGDPSVAQIAQRAMYSHQTVYQALTGPKLPSRAVTAAIANALTDSAEHTLSLWTAAVAEQRNSQSTSKASSYIAQTSYTAQTAVERGEAFTVLRRILEDSIRESGETVLSIAQKSGISRSTVHSALRGDTGLPRWGNLVRILDVLEFDSNVIESEIRPLYVAAQEEINRGNVPIIRHVRSGPGARMAGR